MVEDDVRPSHTIVEDPHAEVLIIPSTSSFEGLLEDCELQTLLK